jgi:CRISPR system Cascade subunit CasB
MSELEFSSILSWWNSLKEDKGGRAELRRAHNPAEVVFLPAYHRLYGKCDASNINKEALACVAGLCAHVKENRGEKFAEQMAADVSGLRFRKLLAIKDREDLYHAMIRVIRQLGGAVNVVDLAKTVYWWNEKTKKELAYAYYANA